MRRLTTSGRVLAATTAAALAVLTAGCGAASKTPAAGGPASPLSTKAPAGSGGPKGKVVVDLEPSLDNPFIAAFAKSFDAQAASLGLTIKRQTNPFDSALQVQQIDDAIAQKAAMIVLLPSNEAAVIPALQRAKAAGIPVLITTSPLKPGHEDLYLSFYGPDQYQLGQIAGQSICSALTTNGRKGGRVAAVTGAQSFYLVTLRMNGFKDALSKCSAALDLVAVEDGKWSTSVSEQVAAQIFAKHSEADKIDAILGMADNQVQGIIVAAEKAGVALGTAPGQLVAVGSNCLGDGVKNIASGKQYATATDIPTEQGKAIANLVGDYFSGKAPAKTVFDPSQMIIKQNLPQFADACNI